MAKPASQRWQLGPESSLCACPLSACFVLGTTKCFTWGSKVTAPVCWGECANTVTYVSTPIKKPRLRELTQPTTYSQLAARPEFSLESVFTGKPCLSCATEAPWIDGIFLGSTGTGSRVTHNLFHIPQAHNSRRASVLTISKWSNYEFTARFQATGITLNMERPIYLQNLSTFHYFLGNVMACDFTIHITLILKVYIFVLLSKSPGYGNMSVVSDPSLLLRSAFAKPSAFLPRVSKLASRLPIHVCWLPSSLIW